MESVLFIIGMALVFVIISLFLFQGKGSWLIAGYNTASPEEKKKYDKKKLCRAMGSLCLVVALMLGVMAYLAYRVESGIMAENDMTPFALVFAGVVLAAICFLLVYANTKCKK